MKSGSKNPRANKATHQDAKPYPDFPLTAHSTGRWAKKWHGKRFYFGTVDDWQSALARFKREWPFITQGKPVPAEGLDANTACTLQVLRNEFLNSKRRKMQSDELSPRTFYGYHLATDALIDHFGKHRTIADLQPVDFERFRVKLAKKYGVVGLRNAINTSRVVFKYASDNRLIDAQVNYGQGFNRPSAKVLRKARNQAGLRLFEADELRCILDKSDPIMRAMVLLGVNCAFGNSDLANLPQSAIELDGSWINFPRVKTEIQRRVPLWRETIDALKVAVANRPQPASRDDVDLCFLTGRGNRWVRVQDHQKTGRLVPINALSQKFAKLRKSLKVGDRGGLGFYTLRRNFQTIGGDAKDPEAVAACMGHLDSSMGAVYRERIPDERLQVVVEVVHRWLWPST